MFGMQVFTTMFQVYFGALAKRHQVGEQKTICRLNQIFWILRILFSTAAYRVTSQRQGHIQATPVVSATTPFFGTGTVSLRSFTVVKKETWVAFQCAEDGVMREDKR